VARTACLVISEIAETPAEAQLETSEFQNLDQILVDAWLRKPRWPWAVALAYTLRSDIRELTFCSVAGICDKYADEAKMGYCADECVRCILQHHLQFTRTDIENIPLSDEEQGSYNNNFPWAEVSKIEETLIYLIEHGEVSTFGRLTEEATLEPIDKTKWTGGEVFCEDTSDLCRVGNRIADYFVQATSEKRVWYYDIHVDSEQLRVALEPNRKQGWGCVKGNALPGRPGSRHLVVTWFAERVSEGKVCSTISDEGRALSAKLDKWRDESSDNYVFPPLTPRSIENAIREKFREYRQSCCI